MGELSRLQREVATAISADPLLKRDGIVVVWVDKASALQEAITAMSGSGILIAVGPPAATFRGDSSVGPVADGGVSIAIQISEPISAGRDQALPSSIDVAERVAWWLHAANHAEAPTTETPIACSDVRPVPDQTAVIYSVICRATAALTGEIAAPETTP